MTDEPLPRRTGLPPAVLAIGYVAALVVPLGLALFSAVDQGSAWSEAASAVGMVAAVMMMLQFVTSGRFETLSGRIGIDVTMAFHKWAARVLLSVVVAHPLFYVAPAFLAEPGLGVTELVRLFLRPRYLTGVIALALVVAVVGLAVWRDRLPVPYELWRGAHLVLALTAAGLVALHAMRAGAYSHAFPLRAVWPLLALVVVASTVIVYGVRTVRMRRERWVVAGNRKVAGDLAELTVRPDGRHRLAFRAGQFAWIAFGPRLFPLFDHPFSIASAPAADGELRFLIKQSGDFTDAIDRVAPGTRVGLDAPHGSFVLDDDDATCIVLLAGGIGIAPVLSVLEDLAARHDPRPVRLVYRCLTPARMVPPAEIEAKAKGLDFAAIYSVREAEEGWVFETARPDRSVLARALQDLDPARTVAMICGPGAMMAATADTLRDLGLPMRRIHYERFDYADETPSAKDRRMRWGFRAMALAVMAAIAAFALR